MRPPALVSSPCGLVAYAEPCRAGEAAVVLVIEDTKCAISDARRQRRIELSLFPANVPVALEWCGLLGPGSGSAHLLAWCETGRLAIVDVRSRVVRVHDTGETLCAARWMPVGGSGQGRGPVLLPGHSGLLLATASGALITCIQSHSNRPFVLRSYPIGPLHNLLQPPGPADSVQILYSLSRSVWIAVLREGSLSVIDVQISLAAPAAVRAVLVREGERVQALGDLLCCRIGLRSQDQEIMVIGESSKDSGRAIVARLGVADGQTAVVEFDVPGFIEAVLACEGASEALLVGAEGVVLIPSLERVPLELLPKGGLSSPRRAGSGGRFVNAGGAFSGNCILCYLLGDNGLVRSVPLVPDSADDSPFVEAVCRAVELGRDFDDVLAAITLHTRAPKDYTFFSLAMLSKVAQRIGPAVKESHLAGVLLCLLQRLGTLPLHCSFLYRYWRINHFWGAAVTSTADLSHTLSAIGTSYLLSRPDRAIESFLGTQEHASIDIAFASIPALIDLASETIEHFMHLFDPFDAAQTTITSSALLVATIHYRITASLVMIRALRDSLVKLVQKYRSLGVFPMMRHFQLVLEELDRPLQKFNLALALQKLSSQRSSATKQFSHLFSTCDTQPPQIRVADLDGVDTAHPSSHREGVILFKRERDLTTGRAVAESLSERCRRCCGLCLPAAQSISEYLEPPFWYSYWQGTCPCGVAV